MKRITVISALFLLLTLSLDAQNLVSTDPYKRNVIIEEYTGVYCGYCPDGHKISNELAAMYQDRVFVLNIHAGDFADVDNPNFMTEDGDIIYSGANVNSFPSGNVNRASDKALGRNNWNLYVEQQVEQMAECNVAGQVVIDKESRKATITVEVYYTSNSASETNYLNVVMLQNNIIAYQSGSNLNPSQVVSGGYRHMHAFRDAVTPAWGEEISPTIAGTFITKTYEYDIPQRIGGSGGFDVNIDDIEFVTFITEQYQGVATRPVLNANKLHTLFATNDNVHPTLLSLGMSSAFTCSNDKVVDVVINNSGVAELTSLKFEVAVDKAEPIVKTWEGAVTAGQTFKVGLDLNVEEGIHNIDVKIVEANGQDYEESKSLSVKKEGWTEMKASGEETQMTIKLMQDKYGNQITWELLASDYSVIASGGPYENLKDTPATALHEIKVDVPVDECVKFVIKDSKSNGICCKYGEGYYQIVNSKGKVIIDGSGDFGAEASHVISIVEGEEDENEEGNEEDNEEETPVTVETPTNLSAYPTVSTVSLTWNHAENAESYNIYRNNTLIENIDRVNYIDEGLEPNTEYCYTVTAVLKDIESGHSNEVCVKTLPSEGIEELTSLFKMYPNPVNDKLYIEAEAEIEEVVIYDVYGRRQKLRISESQNLRNSIDVSGLNSGVYFVKIKTDNIETVKRFVKK